MKKYFAVLVLILAIIGFGLAGEWSVKQQEAQAQGSIILPTDVDVVFVERISNNLLYKIIDKKDSIICYAIESKHGKASTISCVKN